MSKLTDRLRELFAKPKKKSIVPLIYDQINWDDHALKDYASLVPILEHITISYARFTNDNQLSDRITFFNNEKSHGVALMRPFLIDHSSSILPLIALFVDRLKNAGYEINISEIATHQHEYGLESQYKVYLKAEASKRVVVPAEQIFGNVEIQYKVEDDNPLLLRILVNTYKDRNYIDAQSQDDFIAEIFKLI